MHAFVDVLIEHHAAAELDALVHDDLRRLFRLVVTVSGVGPGGRGRSPGQRAEKLGSARIELSQPTEELTLLVLQGQQLGHGHGGARRDNHAAALLRLPSGFCTSTAFAARYRPSRFRWREYAASR